ncbi:MAG: phosphotransferase [Deltaproteobacteria bacterium]|nr:phosphotransferase [Deltaproteobacteria bacterium]
MTAAIIPNTIEEMTPEWLTESLTGSGVINGNAVRAVESEIIGSEQGYMGILARLSLTYEKADDALPSTMVAKIPTREKKNKMIMEAFWNFERENRLYEEILDKLPLRTPRCYFSDFDPGWDAEKVNTVYRRYGKLPTGLVGIYFIYVGLKNVGMKRRYILLLEDFSHLEQIDQRDGCSYADAEMMIKPLGIAHAAFWKSPELNKYWLKNHADFSNMMGFLSGRWPAVVKKALPDKIGQQEMAVFEWLKKNNKQLDEYTRNRPHTLIHTDYRLDNIFFDREKKDIAVIDWQASCPGLGLFDPCFFMLNNGSRAFTPQEAEALITVYHQGLVEGGLSDYSLDECLDDYVYGLLLALRYVLIIVGGVEVEKDPNARYMLGLWFDRMKPLIESIDLSSLFN